MPLSLILKKKCTTCGKDAIEKSSSSIGKYSLITLECGHITTSKSLNSSQQEITSSDGRSLMPYQLDGVKFAEAANARCLIADQQGLGKTVQAAVLLKLHLEDLAPCVIVTKARVKLQMVREMMRWTTSKKVQAIFTSKEIAIPGFDIIVTTYDMLKNPAVFESVKIKSLILDECQQIKNHLSGRAKAVQELVKSHEIEHIVGLSGTPIKNNAGEYFTILNLLDPMRFPQYQRYLDKYCDLFNNGWGNKVGGLKNPEQFHADTKHIIIRRTKEEVLPDLPAKQRTFEHVELDRKLNKAYAAALQELDDLMYSDDIEASERSSMQIAIMTKLRKITGISKVPDCVDFVIDFLESSTEKITIFAHHHSTVDLLQAQLNQYLQLNSLSPCLMLTAGSPEGIDLKFRDSDARVMIASTLAAGEGLNLQFCSNAIMLERQWNPANEEQAEDRHHRYGQENPVLITYMIASGTIDEFFTELVEQKRAIVASTMDGKSIVWNQSSLMNELSVLLTTQGKKKWKM